MPSLKAIRKRIGSVKNTRKITRAMKLVAAAKLRRAQDAIIAARPYAAALSNVVSELSAVAGTDAHPLFEQRDGKRVRSWSSPATAAWPAPFNTNIIKRTEALIREELVGCEVGLRLIGKKANQYFSRRNANIVSFDGAATGPTALQVAGDTAHRIIDDFQAGRVDRVVVVYNEFKSAISQATVVKQVLPVVAEKVAGAAEPTGGRQGLRLRAEQGRAPDPAGAAVRPDRPVPRGPRVDRRRVRRPHERDGVGDQERRRDDQQADAAVQPRASGRDHQGAARDHRRRRGPQGLSASSPTTLAARRPDHVSATNLLETPRAHHGH
jgi:ATP synthase F1 gamma subunit